jgi:hypothetical protein
VEDVFDPHGFDMEDALEAIARQGATSVPLLAEGFRLELLEEAKRVTYQLEPEVVGSGERVVRQQLATCEIFPLGSQYLVLQAAIQHLLESRLAEIEPYPFETPLHLDALALQKYAAGSLGITPHRDGLKYVNLIVVVVIAGKGRFCICADRSGRDAREIAADPGRAILMRAPGLYGSQERPFHFVDRIRGDRWTFGLRQRRE